jgi:hypothetical protein
MKVKELREILELIDGECEVLVVDSSNECSGVQKVGIDPYFDNCGEYTGTPLCIRSY